MDRERRAMLNVVMIGVQGSGKGTQAKLVAQTFGLTVIEAGALIRKRAEGHDKKAQIIDHLVNLKGILLPDGIVLDMIDEELEERKAGKGYLFDGFPRTERQYLALKEIMIEKHEPLSAAVNLQISDEEAMRRLAARRHCERCGKGYSLMWEPERARCDCGGSLGRRADDVPEAIAERLKRYHETTKPALTLMERDGILITVNGERSVEVIFEDVRETLKKLVDLGG